MTHSNSRKSDILGRGSPNRQYRNCSISKQIHMLDQASDCRFLVYLHILIFKLLVLTIFDTDFLTTLAKILHYCFFTLKFYLAYIACLESHVNTNLFFIYLYQNIFGCNCNSAISRNKGIAQCARKYRKFKVNIPPFRINNQNNFSTVNKIKTSPSREKPNFENFNSILLL